MGVSFDFLWSPFHYGLGVPDVSTDTPQPVRLGGPARSTSALFHDGTGTPSRAAPEWMASANRLGGDGTGAAGWNRPRGVRFYFQPFECTFAQGDFIRTSVRRAMLTDKR